MTTKTWNMERKFVRRRRVVFGLAVAIALYAIFQVSGHLWWVGGEEGYCWGEMIECYFGEGK
jgi:hypothetical protein